MESEPYGCLMIIGIIAACFTVGIMFAPPLGLGLFATICIVASAIGMTR